MGSEVLHAVSSFTDWLANATRDLGVLHCGPNQTLVGGWATEYLLCLYRDWPGLENVPECTYREPEAEIFEATDELYYAKADSLVALTSEVLVDFYSGEHGLQVGELERDIRKRLRKACLAECHSLGYNRAAASEIASGVINDLMSVAPSSWSWDRVQEVIGHYVENYASARRRPYIWMVQEQLIVEPGQSLREPIADGDLLRQMIPAMHQEDNSKKWLLEAQPLLMSLRFPMPEFDAVRLLELGELFVSECGVLYHSEDAGPTWIGEIATDLLHERHGECVPDAEHLVRNEVMRLVLQKIEDDQPLTPDLYAEAVDAAHEIAAGADVLRTWYRDIPSLVDEVLKKVDLSGS